MENYQVDIRSFNDRSYAHELVSYTQGEFIKSLSIETVVDNLQSVYVVKKKQKVTYRGVSLVDAVLEYNYL